MQDELFHITQQAANEVLKYYGQNANIQYKKDDSPLTKADLAAHDIIKRGLNETYPDILVISEEDTTRLNSNLLPRQYFLVDPLDGTKEFIAQNGEFAISIGLIDHGYPSMGILHMPAKDIVYYGGKSGAFYKVDQKQWTKIAPQSVKNGLTLLQSKRSSKTEVPKNITKKPITKTINVGSAYKFALIAEGKAHIYPRKEPLKEWDTAAGQAIVEAAGGQVVDFEGKRLRYGKKDYTHSGFIVLGVDAT